jgi:hypothetical protein
MLRTAALIFCCAALSCAQDRREGNPERRERNERGERKRIESVVWDLKEHRLIWTVQRGTEGPGGQFTVKSSEKYEISPDEAVMFFANEKRGFTKEEAASLHKLLDTLSVYCAESVVWWDRGEGRPGGDSDQKLRVEDRKPEQPVKQAEPAAAPIVEIAAAR